MSAYNRNSFDDLLNRLNDGDKDAAALIVRRFSAQLIAQARIELDPELQRKVDAEDVVQSALGSFFHRYDQGDFALANWNSLWGLLVKMTVRKCWRRNQFFHASRRDIRRERFASDDGGDQLDPRMVDDKPSAEQVAACNELIENLITGMDLKSHRDIFKLSLKGYSQREISQRVQRSQYTVSKVLDRVRNSLEQSLGLDQPPGYIEPGTAVGEQRT